MLFLCYWKSNEDPNGSIVEVGEDRSSILFLEFYLSVFNLAE